jgi:hypothetical protein
VSAIEENPVPVIPPGRIGDRFVAVFMTVTLVLFAAMTGLVIYLVVRVSDLEAGQQAASIRQCQLANGTRLQDIAIWNRLLRLPPGASAEQKAEAAELERLVTVKDAPRDCTAAYSG